MSVKDLFELDFADTQAYVELYIKLKQAEIEELKRKMGRK